MHERIENPWLLYIKILILDFFCLWISIIISASVLDIQIFENYDIYINYFILFSLASAFAAFAFRSYDAIVSRGYALEFKSTIIHGAGTLIIFTFSLFLFKTSSIYSRILTVLSAIIFVFVSYGAHCAYKKWARNRSDKVLHVNCILICKSYSEGTKLIKYLRNERGRVYREVFVFCEDYHVGDQSDPSIKYIGSLEDMFHFAVRNAVDEAILSQDYLGDQTVAIGTDLINMGIIVDIVLPQSMRNLPNCEIHQIGDISFIKSSFGIVTTRQIIIKRMMDIFGNLIGIVLFGIAFIIFGPIIKIQSPDGPILFKQKRVGKNGRVFTFYKFRSMYPDAEERKKELMDKNEMNGLMFKMDDDPRIIPIGHFLRKSSVDELPQFINVLKGDMSLVGTRPPTLDEFEKYQKHHKIRLSLKPGITGLWQISGRNEITDFEEVVKLDRAYLDGWSLLKDLKILFATIFVVFKRTGAK